MSVEGVSMLQIKRLLDHQTASFSARTAESILKKKSLGVCKWESMHDFPIFVKLFFFFFYIFTQLHFTFYVQQMQHD